MARKTIGYLNLDHWGDDLELQLLVLDLK